MFEKKVGGVTIGINPNTELIYTMLNLTSTSAALRQRPPSPDVLTRFAKYKNLPAVQELDSGGKLGWNEGFHYSEAASFPFYFSDLPEGKRLYDYKDDFLNQILKGMTKEEKIKYLDAYWEKARDFYNTSGFADYLRQNAATYQTDVDAVAAHMPPFDPIKLHEDYHAKRGYHFFIVPSPLSLPQGGNYGLRFGDSIYNLMGADFSNSDAVSYMTLHEFGHLFCNPVVDSNLDAVGKYAFLMSGIEHEMNDEGYSTWRDVMQELLVRAVHARLVLHTQGVAAAEKFLEGERARKFVFIEDFYNALDVYERKRDKYPTLFEFYPVLLETLDNWELKYVQEAAASGVSAHWNKGLVLDGVPENSYASAAGLCKGDVILSVDGAAAARWFFYELQAGKKSLLEVVRADGNHAVITLVPPAITVKRPVHKTGG